MSSVSEAYEDYSKNRGKYWAKYFKNTNKVIADDQIHAQASTGRASELAYRPKPKQVVLAVAPMTSKQKQLLMKLHSELGMALPDPQTLHRGSASKLIKQLIYAKQHNIFERRLS